MSDIDQLDADGLVDALFSNTYPGNPYPLYHRLRALAPVHRTPVGSWVLSRHSDNVSALRDPRLGRDFPLYLDAQPGLRAAWPTSEVLHSQALWMLNLHPPDHTRIRRLYMKAFTANRLEALRPRIHALIDDLLDAAAATDEFDVVTGLAFPLPITVIADMLGVPREEQSQFLTWTQAVSASVEPVRTPQTLANADAAVAAYEAYFRALIATRRRDPQDDLLSALIAAEEHGDVLTEDELVSNTILLFSAGFDTTMNLIGNGVHALLRNPSELDRLRHDPSLVPGAVEEILRYDGSVQLTDRTALEPVEIGGCLIAAGETVITLLGAANRDPARYMEPDRFDVGRTDVKPLTFGGGIHYCLGAAVGRLEAQMAIEALSRRFTNIRLIDDDPPWRPTLTNHGLQRLRVSMR